MIEKERYALVCKAYNTLPHWRMLLKRVNFRTNYDSEIDARCKKELDKLEEKDKRLEDDRW